MFDYTLEDLNQFGHTAEFFSTNVIHGETYYKCYSCNRYFVILGNKLDRIFYGTSVIYEDFKSCNEYISNDIIKEIIE